MEFPEITPGGVARTAGYLLVGAAGTAALALGLLQATSPLGAGVYRAFYLAAGPWDATVAATVLTVLAAGLLALGGVTVGTATALGGVDRRLAGGVAGLVVAVLVLVAAATAAGVAGLPVALVAAGAFVVGVGLVLSRVGARRESHAAFAGGVPVLALLVLLLGVGLGWGGGYDVVATEVSPSAVDGADAEFGAAPELREDLLSPAGSTGYCETEDGRRVCRLPLRGYAGEDRAARFLARHGARCPYLNGGAADGGSFVAVDGDTYYRVSCEAYGD